MDYTLLTREKAKIISTVQKKYLTKLDTFT